MSQGGIRGAQQRMCMLLIHLMRISQLFMFFRQGRCLTMWSEVYHNNMIGLFRTNKN